MEFETFVRAYQDMVFSTAIRIVGNSADAQDVSQTVFVQAFKQFDRLSTDPAVGGWLRTTARNLSINHYNRYQNRWRFFSAFDTEDAAYEPPHPSDDAEWLHERADDLREALMELPPKYRAPLVLHHYEDQSYEEIAASLKISLAKVKVDAFRGRELLKKKLLKRSES